MQTDHAFTATDQIPDRGSKIKRELRYFSTGGSAVIYGNPGTPRATVIIKVIYHIVLVGEAEWSAQYLGLNTGRNIQSGSPARFIMDEVLYEADLGLIGKVSELCLKNRHLPTKGFLKRSWEASSRK